MLNEGAAIQICKARKSYLSTPVLEDVNLNVSTGSIYSLLGASGCGKTTLLSCIIGIDSLDSGTIHVFGSRPGALDSGIPGSGVGYMSQDIALHSFFTPSEILSYYGSLHGMTETEKRKEDLLQFLQLLEFKDRSINTLSGGQQRRVSLAVALFHKPPLLILDEPTIGLDPLLRQKIWQHMTDLVVKDGITILITTHYIEEARFSDKVGILRKGRILTEDSPDNLLSAYKKTTLEAAVLQLCHQQTSEKVVATIAENPAVEPFIYTYSEDSECRILQHRKLSNASFHTHTLKSKEAERRKHQTWRRIVLTLAWKNLVKDFRSKVSCVTQVVLPILLVVILENTVGTVPKTLRLGIVPETPFSTNPCPTNFTEKCWFQSEHSGICEYLHLLRKQHLKLSYYNDSTSALNAVQLGHSIGYISIPANFSQAFKSRLVYGKFATEDLLSEMEIRLDHSNFINTNYVVKSITDAYLEFVQQTVTNCGSDGDVSRVQIPLKFNAVYGNFRADGFTRQFEPAILVLFLFLLTTAPVKSHVLEKVQGLVDRDAVAGVKVWHSITAFLISGSFIAVMQIVMFILILCCVYGMTIKGSWALFLLSLYGTALTGISFGFLLSTFVSSGLEYSLMDIALVFLFLISSGFILPITFTPLIHRVFCYLLPVTLPMQTLSEITLRGGGLLHPSVYPGFLASLGWITVSFIVSVFKKKVHLRNLFRTADNKD